MYASTLCHMEPILNLWTLQGVMRTRYLPRLQEQHNMEPSVSVHHFVHPAWFEEKGGWTKEANIALFVNFAVEAFKRFGQHAKLWSSFNEPTVLSLLPHAIWKQ